MTGGVRQTTGAHRGSQGLPRGARGARSARARTFLARSPSSAVSISLHSESTTRARSASALKPAKTTEWIAPMRVDASIVYAASGTIGM